MTSILFGEPRKGIHADRLHITKSLDVATNDVLLTLGGAYIYSKVYNKEFVPSLIILMVIAIILHWLFGVSTALNVYLGLAPKTLEKMGRR